MLIILDTNSLHGKWNFENPELKSFFLYAEKTRSKILIPEIVWNEIKKNYRDEFIEKREKYAAAAKQFSSAIIDGKKPIVYEADAEEQTNHYMTWLDQKLNTLSDKIIIPFNNTTLNRLARRATYKLPPFNKTNDKELKDALVWESVIDVLSDKSNYPDKDICLISHDGCFGSSGKKEILNEILRKEADDLTTASGSTSLLFYRTTTHFLSEHNSPIAGISSEKINEYLISAEGIDIHLKQFKIFNNESVRRIVSYALTGITQNPLIQVDISSSKLINLIPNDSYYINAISQSEKCNIICEREGELSFRAISYLDSTYAESKVTEEKAEVGFSISMSFDKGEFKDLQVGVSLKGALGFRYNT
jgi:hypothetical protein